MATNPSLSDDASRRRHDPVVTDLVTRAGKGDHEAWDALVERYAPLIWSICPGTGLATLMPRMSARASG